MVNIQTILHPLMRKVAKSLVKFPVTAFDVHPFPSNEPFIICTNHSNVHDFPLQVSTFKPHFYALADDTPKGSVTGYAIEASGAIWINRNDKESRKAGYSKMLELLEKGENILIFPEGTWNIHECLPMLPITWSTTELSRKTGYPIIPVTIEYPDFNSAYYSVGEPFYVQKEEGKAEAATRLRDVMATMRWKYWETKGVVSRKTITQADYELYSVERCKEYQHDNWKEYMDYEKGMIFHPYTTREQAFEFFQHLIPSKANAFLFDKRNHY